MTKMVANKILHIPLQWNQLQKRRIDCRNLLEQSIHLAKVGRNSRENLFSKYYLTFGYFITHHLCFLYDLTYLISSDTTHAILNNQRVVLAPKVLLAGRELSSLLVGHPQYPTIVAIENGPADPIEAGFTFSPDQTFSFVTDYDQTVIFSASIEDSAGGNQKRIVALQRDESITPILIEGDFLNSNDFPIVSSIPDTPMVFSADRSMAIMAQIQWNQGEPKSVILTKNTGDFYPHVSAFQPYSGLPQNSTISEFFAPISLKEDNLIFSGCLSGGSVNQTDDQFVATISKAGELDLIIQ